MDSIIRSLWPQTLFFTVADSSQEANEGTESTKEAVEEKQQSKSVSSTSSVMKSEQAVDDSITEQHLPSSNKFSPHPFHPQLAGQPMHPYCPSYGQHMQLRYPPPGPPYYNQVYYPWPQTSLDQDRNTMISLENKLSASHVDLHPAHTNVNPADEQAEGIVSVNEQPVGQQQSGDVVTELRTHEDTIDLAGPASVVIPADSSYLSVKPVDGDKSSTEVKQPFNDDMNEIFSHGELY